MNFSHFAILWLFLFSLLSPCGAHSLSFFDKFVDKPLFKKEIMNCMSDEEKVGQLFLVTYPGDEMTPELKEWIVHKHLGGIKIYGWNAGEIKKLVTTLDQARHFSLQTPYQIPLLICTDQEGGWVQHIRNGMSSSVGNLGISATNSPWESYLAGLAIGKELNLIGVNMNFAPTVDLYTNYQNLVIGPRSFSADPKKVAMFALAYYKGLKEAGIIATAKHFPGHGEATEDSHGVLPQVNLSCEQLKARELIPYCVLIQEGIPAVMAGHLLFPQVCSHTSSLSAVFLKEILRGELGFKQIILTDDLVMTGASVSGLSSAQVAEKAIRAGNTLLLTSVDFKTLEKIRQHFLLLMRQDSGFKSLVEESVACNLQVKLDYLHEKKLEDTFSVEQRLASLPLGETSQVLQETAIRSVTKLKLDRGGLSTQKKTLLVSAYPEFLSEGKRFFVNSQPYRYAYLPLQTPCQKIKFELRSLAPSYEQIIFNLTTPASLSYLQALRPWNEKLTVISSLSPVLLAKIPWLKRCLVVYGINTPSYRAGFWALLGKYEPTGSLPLEINV